MPWFCLDNGNFLDFLVERGELFTFKTGLPGGPAGTSGAIDVSTGAKTSILRYCGPYGKDFKDS